MNKNKRRVLAGIAALVFALIVTALLLLWYQVFQDRFYPKRFGVVCDGKIFRSGRINPVLLEDVFRKNGIRTIISLTGKDEHSGPESEIAEKLGIKMFYFTLQGSGICSAQEYADVLKVLDDSSKNNPAVLVHCSAGVNRTGGTIALYRMLIEKKTSTEAYDELLDYGWSPSKNAQLIPHLNSNIKEIAEILAKDGVIDKVPDPIPQFELK